MEKGISFGKMEVKHITVQTTFPYNKEVYTSQLLQKRLEFTWIYLNLRLEKNSSQTNGWTNGQTLMDLLFATKIIQ